MPRRSRIADGLLPGLGLEGDFADGDLGSLALDLLMSEAGYHRGSGNPLLWHRP